jgi:hypothetical protein
MSIMLWGSVELALLDTQKPAWYSYYGSWFLSTVAEVTLFGLSLATNKTPNNFEIVRLCVEGSRLLVFLALPLGLWAVRGQDSDEPIGEESARLLGSEASQASPSDYGSVADPDADSEAMRKAKERMMKKLEESGSWWAYAKSFSVSVRTQLPTGFSDNSDRRFFGPISGRKATGGCNSQCSLWGCACWLGEV